MQNALIKAAAARAGIHDLDALKLADFSKAVDAAGKPKDPTAFIAELKRTKPHLFAANKSVHKMSPAEFRAAKRELSRQAADVVAEVPPNARTLSADEYQLALRDVGASYRPNRFR